MAVPQYLPNTSDVGVKYDFTIEAEMMAWKTGL
jgi:hypothetical protein